MFAASYKKMFGFNSLQQMLFDFAHIWKVEATYLLINMSEALFNRKISRDSAGHVYAWKHFFFLLCFVKSTTLLQYKNDQIGQYPHIPRQWSPKYFLMISLIREIPKPTSPIHPPNDPPKEAFWKHKARAVSHTSNHVWRSCINKYSYSWAAGTR